MTIRYENITWDPWMEDIQNYLGRDKWIEFNQNLVIPLAELTSTAAMLIFISEEKGNPVKIIRSTHASDRITTRFFK